MRESSGVPPPASLPPPFRKPRSLPSQRLFRQLLWLRQADGKPPPPPRKAPFPFPQRTLFHFFALRFLLLRKLVSFLDGGFFRLIYLLYAVIQETIAAFLFVHIFVNYSVNSLDFQGFSKTNVSFYELCT